MLTQDEHHWFLPKKCMGQDCTAKWIVAKENSPYWNRSHPLQNTLSDPVALTKYCPFSVQKYEILWFWERRHPAICVPRVHIFVMMPFLVLGATLRFWYWENSAPEEFFAVPQYFGRGSFRKVTQRENGFDVGTTAHIEKACF